MLRIAGAAAALITLVEGVVLYPLVRIDPVQLGLTLGLFNLALAAVVGYFAVGGIAVGGAGQREGALRIVQDTLPFLRQGLNRETAAKTAEILAQLDSVHGVLVAGRQEVLAVSGRCLEDPDALERVRRAVARAQARGGTRLARLPAREGRPAATAVAVPLQCQREVVGALALVAESRPGVVADVSRSAEVFARLLSMQIELGQLDRQARLAAEAELSALRAQINPHFFFNTLNTIISYSRDDPEMARRLLLRLADLFRITMHLQGQIIPFAEEYQHVRDYLFIEQARFRDRLRVVYDIDPQVLKVGVPALSVQPLVENAVRHGIAPKGAPGTVEVRARLDFLLLRVQITVRDDGVGMPPERIPELLRPRPGTRPAGGDRNRPGRAAGGGVGLSNINERLRRLYGDAYSLEIESAPGRGTTVHLRVPMR
ncbi:sensor histidine kinase [Caldinitratiruptor microaerophilus]|uniref:histidine kinase n=1 Tax=Caldinitratiruptor microaerophilus TaxID=671077 RepID=A0AA35CQ25_9FIRM|nr:histidine kinase [Caldinitratiruptor microaerophilus]BDG62082.1 histidine kinase [Caldinitratiruptor microaerophilus]